MHRIHIQKPPWIMDVSSSYLRANFKGLMNHFELKYLINELQEIDERFKIGLTLFIEGAQGFHGNLRLLLEPYLFQEYEHELYELIQCRGLRWGFCFRSEATFVMISS